MFLQLESLRGGGIHQFSDFSHALTRLCLPLGDILVSPVILEGSLKAWLLAQPRVKIKITELSRGKVSPVLKAPHWALLYASIQVTLCARGPFMGSATIMF